MQKSFNAHALSCLSVEADSQSREQVLQDQIERLLDRLQLAVIFGGDKFAPGGVVYQCHNTRSWKSYEAVAHDIAASLGRIGFRNVQVMPDDMALGDRLKRNNVQMAWLNTGGVQGYNPAAHAPAMLEMFGVPYVGHDPLNATTLDNKHAFKREAICAGLKTAPFCTWHMARGPFRPEINSRFQLAFGDYQGPFIVKPVSGRASLNVHFVEDRSCLPEVIEMIYQATENVVLIEKYLDGREYCIAVAGPVTSRGGKIQRNSEPFTFGALERVLSSDEMIFTSMDVKPITDDRFRNLSGPEDAEVNKSLRRLACDVFLEFNLGALIRIDLRADKEGNMYILEANPKPDLKNTSKGVTSLVAAGLPEVGMTYDDLILSLLADRLDFLFNHRSASVQHILDLLEPTSVASPSIIPQTARAELAPAPAKARAAAR